MSIKSINKPNPADFRFERDNVFDRIAERYDLLCDLFSFGIHRLWKRAVAKRIASEKWSCLLDGATGTGDIIYRLQSRDVSDRTIIAADVSKKMLALAERRLRCRAENVQLQLLNAQAMPSIESGSVDAYSISLALKICDRSLVLQEALRVLRPGGRLIILEASNIRWAVLNRWYLRYMALCMPIVGYLATGGDSSAYKYLLEGIRGFPTAEELADELRVQFSADRSARQWQKYKRILRRTYISSDLFGKFASTRTPLDCVAIALVCPAQLPGLSEAFL